jgi:hypothetical protein
MLELGRTLAIFWYKLEMTEKFPGNLVEEQSGA